MAKAAELKLRKQFFLHGADQVQKKQSFLCLNVMAWNQRASSDSIFLLLPDGGCNKNRCIRSNPGDTDDALQPVRAGGSDPRLS